MPQGLVHCAHLERGVRAMRDGKYLNHNTSGAPCMDLDDARHILSTPADGHMSADLETLATAHTAVRGVTGTRRPCLSRETAGDAHMPALLDHELEAHRN